VRMLPNSIAIASRKESWIIIMVEWSGGERALGLGSRDRFTYNSAPS
jgi:hypothetical protein